MAPKRSYNKKLRSFNEPRSETVVRNVRPEPKAGPLADRSRWLAPLILVGCSLFLRFIALGHVNSVIFDEVHFGKFISQYCCKKERFFDIHPPHAKLILGATASAAGYDGNFTFQNIGQDFGNEVNPWAIRWFPALMGALIPFLVWIVMRQLGASRPAAFLAGMAIVLDNAFTTQSRVLGLDTLLVGSILGSIAVFLHALKRSTSRRWAWLLGAGALGGIATGCKVTGGACLALMTVVLFRPFFARRSKENFKFAVKGVGWLALGSIPIYVVGFLLHFAILTNPGSGDRFYKPIDSPIVDIWKFQQVMLRSNYFLTQTHPGMSKYWEWLIDRKPIFYWSKGKEAIFLWGNPVLWIGSSLLFFFILASKVMGRVTSLRVLRSGGRTQSLEWIPLLGFAISFLPMAGIPRALFLYHYFTPLVFVTMYVVLWLDGAEWIKSSRFTRQRASYYAVLGFLIAGFIAVAPTTYGFNWSDSYHSTLTTFLHNWK